MALKTEVGVEINVRKGNKTRTLTFSKPTMLIELTEEEASRIAEELK